MLRSHWMTNAYEGNFSPISDKDLMSLPMRATWAPLFKYLIRIIS